MLVQLSKCGTGRSLEVTSLLDMDDDLEIVVKGRNHPDGLSSFMDKDQVIELRDHLNWVLENRYELR